MTLTLSYDVTATTIVLGALAARDWRPMHHDYDFSRSAWKFHYVERNRLVNVLTHYDARTLALLFFEEEQIGEATGKRQRQDVSLIPMIISR